MAAFKYVSRAAAVLAALFVVASAFEFCQDAPAIVGIGSSTVFPIADLYSRQYLSEHVYAIARSSGSTLGIRNLLLGAADIGHASRAMQAKDYNNADCDGSLVTADGQATGPCQGVQPVGIQVASDVIAIVANSQASLDSTTSANLATLFAEGSQFNLYIPDMLSGTYDFFVETTGFEPSGVTEFFADDGELVRAIASDPNGLGFVGIGHVQGASGIKVVPVDGVDPSADGDVSSYAFFRPLFMYYDTNSPMRQSLERYLCGLVTPQGQQVVTDAGFLALSVSELAAQTSSLSCSSLPAVSAEQFDGGDEQFIFCKDVRAILSLGSSTVFPATSAAADTNANAFAYPLSRSAGSSVGIQTYLAGATDLAAASRALAPKDYEAFGCDPAGVTDNGVAVAECQGRVPVGLVIGRDMLSIIVPTGSATNGGLSLSELQAAVANPATTLCVPDVQSGTRDFFEDEVAVVPDGVTGFTNDEDIVACVRTGGANTIGVVPVAYLTGEEANTDGIRILNIDGQSPIDNPESYPLSRPLFLYFDSTPFATDDLSQNFMCRMMSEAGQALVTSVGYTAVANPAESLSNVGLICPEMFLL